MLREGHGLLKITQCSQGRASLDSRIDSTAPLCCITCAMVLTPPDYTAVNPCTSVSEPLT